jgi:hypothetical protein
MFSTPQDEFELVSKKMKQVVSYGKGKNTKKVINWRMTENDGIKHIQAYQLGGANINLTIVPSINNLHELVDFSHDGRFQQSVDLLATILEHKGAYHQLVNA